MVVNLRVCTWHKLETELVFPCEHLATYKVDASTIQAERLTNLNGDSKSIGQFSRVR
jgi:hypothetical protein